MLFEYCGFQLKDFLIKKKDHEESPKSNLDNKEEDDYPIRVNISDNYFL